MLRGQSPPEGSERGVTLIPSFAFLVPGPPTSDGSRGGMEIILLACVCVCLSVSAQRCECWGTTSAGQAGARGLREAPAAPWGAGCRDAGMLLGGSPGSLPQDCTRLLPPGPDPTGEIRSGFWGAAYFAHDIGRGLAPRRGVDSDGGNLEPHWETHPSRAKRGKNPDNPGSAPLQRGAAYLIPIYCSQFPRGERALPRVLLMPAGSALVLLFCFEMRNY